MKRKVETLQQLQEVLSPRANILLGTMTEVMGKHRSLGPRGKDKTSTNQFGDMAMVADVEAENTIIVNAIKHSEKDEIAIMFCGEEKGKGIIRNGQIEYWGREDKSESDQNEVEFWVLDGLDGSENYATTTDWPYGTMLSVADSPNPSYNDFKTCAICMEEEGWVVIADAEGEVPGVFVVDLNNGNVKKLTKFDDSTKFDQNTILADNYFTETKELIRNRPELAERRTGSTAATVVSMIIRNQITDYKYPKMNDIHSVLVDVTRKGNLEQPAVYLLLKLLGGDVLDINDNSIGDEKFKTWGQSSHLPIFPITNTEHFNDLKEHLGLKEIR